MVWQAVIFGPDDTPWEGGTFKLVLEFTEGMVFCSSFIVSLIEELILC